MKVPIVDRERKPYIHLHGDERYISIGFLDDNGVLLRGDVILKMPEPYPYPDSNPNSDHNVAVRWAKALEALLA